MGSESSAKKTLSAVFGYEAFRHSQETIIETLLAGQDTLVLMPTGGGKSLCYQIPALIRDGVGIVISPLIALMQDQVDALQQLGIRAAFLNSSQSSLAREHVESELVAGNLDLLYVAPERLLMPNMLSLFNTCKVALFAIDEAHCVSQWGHDFRPEYQQLSVLHERFPSVPRIALTATADPRTRDEIVAQLALSEAAIFVSSFDRPNIHYAISEGDNPKQRLWRFIEQSHAEDAGIVYCLSRKKVEATADWLNEQGREALPYHAGLSAEVRQHHQQRFLREEGLIMVATIAFGMGIDKPDVRFVAHLSLPKSVEAYYQETGRAGRDGLAANAWMAYSLQDVITLRQFTQTSNADERQKRVEHHKLESMLGLCELISCRRHALLAYFGEESTMTCGQCDNCQQPPESWDATEDARKALSCVYRTGERFGVNYIIAVLRGDTDDRIQQNGHEGLSTYGIGQDKSVLAWRSVFRQLIALGYLDIDASRYGALRLTVQCRDLLKGVQTLSLRQFKATESGRSSKEKASSVRSQDQVLWDALRALRLQLAETAGVPPYVIFHDATLRAMLVDRPDTLGKMAAISGVGQQKLSRYGQSFVDIVQAHPLPALLDNRLSATVNETLLLHDQGLSFDEIAAKREIQLVTVFNHLAQAIESGLLEVRVVLGLSQKEYVRIVAMMTALEAEAEGKLKRIYDAFEGEYDYGVLRCVKASL